ncbi:MAG: hypothetical protein GY851_00525, partial [bacterium]|nr:hypothetical protein [bacterium]
DVAIAETVTLIAEDPAATIVSLDGDPGVATTHRSTEVTDEFGSRSAAMVFKGDNRAYAVDARGETIGELGVFTVRATEFATLASMPAALPPASAYTYCVELRVDGVERVRFDKPVVVWVDNFLDFDVGEIVPVGYYDRDRGVWTPSKNGVVVQLLDVDADGAVDALDASGDGVADDLDNDGLFIDEVEGLEDGGRYASGDTFWRFSVTHFSPRDCNWPPALPPGARGPNPSGEPDAGGQGAGGNGSPPGDCNCTNSYVKNRSRVFHEDIPIPGVDMTLHYAGDGVEGRKYTISVPASGDDFPSSAKWIVGEAKVGGRVLERVLDPLPNQHVDFVWDGLDYLGRRLDGRVGVRIRVGFVYETLYAVAGNFDPAFGQAGGASMLSTGSRQLITLWKRSMKTIHAGAARKDGVAEGWTLSAHHHVNA